MLMLPKRQNYTFGGLLVSESLAAPAHQAAFPDTLRNAPDWPDLRRGQNTPTEILEVFSSCEEDLRA